jgi:archaellum component FlaC
MSGDNKAVLKLLKDLENETDAKLLRIEKTAEEKIIAAVKNLQLDIERKIDHKVNNLKMSIVGLESQHEHLDSLLNDVREDIKTMAKSVNKVSGNQQAMSESVKHFSDTIKWILTIGGTLFLSLLTFVLFKGI